MKPKNIYYDADGNKVSFVECLECDESVQCKVHEDESGEDVEVPDTCPACGELMTDGVEPSHTEDFHSDV